ncbi:MAG: hypothetical protein JO154_00110 [Chitinophaga sp.]|uniref:hypothetical protein n=1 Tax=Chitinophaga sp. TaxID=1869181 RepID=UPI0025BF5587|nr:hypothetical protein [Chitinophaga sp.]MBV8250980.1 hypothetical protein [Chitinophaga sp.]
MLKVRYILSLVLLLCLQLAASARVHTHQKAPLTLFQQIDQEEAQEEYFENLIERLHLKTDLDEDDIPDSLHATRSTRKTKYYLSATNQQSSIANRITYIDTDGIAESIYFSPLKTGRYLPGKSFRPAYYSFLFRFTPF